MLAALHSILFPAAAQLHSLAGALRSLDSLDTLPTTEPVSCIPCQFRSTGGRLILALYSVEFQR